MFYFIELRKISWNKEWFSLLLIFLIQPSRSKISVYIFSQNSKYMYVELRVVQSLLPNSDGESSEELF